MGMKRLGRWIDKAGVHKVTVAKLAHDGQERALYSEDLPDLSIRGSFACDNLKAIIESNSRQQTGAYRNRIRLQDPTRYCKQ